jgi:hypothetical protein
MGVTAFSITESFGKILEQLRRCFLVSQESEGLSACVKVIPFCQGDDFVGKPSELFCFRLCGADPLVLDQLLKLIAKKGLPMARRAVQFSP